MTPMTTAQTQSQPEMLDELGARAAKLSATGTPYLRRNWYTESLLLGHDGPEDVGTFDEAGGLPS